MLRKIKAVLGSRFSVLGKEILLCVFCGLLLILSYPNFNFWIFTWFGFVPLFFVLEGKSKRKAFFLAYLSGIIFWLGIIYWLVHVSLVGTILLILYLALYFGIFGLIFSTINYKLSTPNLLFIPSVWVLLEYIRGHLFGGFPWALLAYSQWKNLLLIQIADIFGAWGVSFWVMLINLIIYSVVRRPYSVFRQRKEYIFFFFLLFITLIYGAYKIYAIRNTPYAIQQKISVIQGNIPQELKWNPLSQDYIFNKYLYLTSEVVKKDKPDLVVWPEAAMPVILTEEPILFEKLKLFIKEINTPLLLGAVREENGFYYNSAILFSKDGKLLKHYDKLHLVPFGEYIPFKKIFGFLETLFPIGDFKAGSEYTVFNSGIKFSVLICFEDLFPQISRKFCKKGIDFLINITNDAWFKKTPAAYQHLQASVFRAVENRIYLIRAANTGVSGFINPEGKIISLVEDQNGKNLFIDGDRSEIIFANKNGFSFYTHFGDCFILVCLFIILITYYKKLNYA